MKICVTLIISFLIFAACTEKRENKHVEQINNEKYIDKYKSKNIY